ncbi:MAG: transporter substrate-binding domain-containing protein, partial [Puniceicoccales bacterium]|nr:transporter substrate-binding domain-containing protein [Puniceicoccales bacterium]
ENIPNAELIAVDKSNLAVELLKAGHAECVYIDVFVADIYCQQNPEFSYFLLDSLKISEGIAIGLPKGSPLKDELNRALKILETSGKLQSLKNKWKLLEPWTLSED